MRMRAILEYAREEIGRKFGAMPMAPLPVILHTKQPFAQETGTPAWADTLVDHETGALHIPVANALDDLGSFSRVVRHALVHAILHARMGSSPNAMPTWLAEGLALELAEDDWPDLDPLKLPHLPLLPLHLLEKPWTVLSITSLPIAYVEADVAVRNLTNDYGMYGIRQVLAGIKSGQSLEVALASRLNLSYDRFLHQWADNATARLTHDFS